MMRGERVKKMKRKSTIHRITEVALIGAIYTVLTLISGPLAFGPVQFRLSEALTLLPLFSPVAVYGLGFGCFFSNLLGFLLGLNPLGLIDAVVGTAATLIAAFLTKWAGALPLSFPKRFIIGGFAPVLSNAVIVGAELTILFNGNLSPVPYLVNAGAVAAGEVAVIVTVGAVLCFCLQKNENYKMIFPQTIR